MSLVTEFAVFGERCSGTKYLRRLVELNFTCSDTPRVGAKHWFYDKDHVIRVGTASTLFLVIVRDPRTWLRSMWAQPYHVHSSLRGVTFDQFIQKEWRCNFDETSHTPPGHPNFGAEMMFERSPETGKRFANVVQMRSAKLRALLELRRIVDHFVVITYEELVSSPQTVVKFLETRFGLPRRTERINLGKKHAPKPHEPLEERHVAHVKKYIDEEVEKIVGYAL